MIPKNSRWSRGIPPIFDIFLKNVMSRIWVGIRWSWMPMRWTTAPRSFYKSKRRMNFCAKKTGGGVYAHSKCTWKTAHWQAMFYGSFWASVLPYLFVLPCVAWLMWPQIMWQAESIWGKFKDCDNLNDCDVFSASSIFCAFSSFLKSIHPLGVLFLEDRFP